MLADVNTEHSNLVTSLVGIVAMSAAVTCISEDQFRRRQLRAKRRREKALEKNEKDKVLTYLITC